MTAFLVDRDTPGVVVERRLPTMCHPGNGTRPCELRFDDVVLNDAQVLGTVGHGFVPLQNRFSIRRLEVAAKSVGASARLLQMLLDQARKRVTFGEPLASRQTIQNWIADAAPWGCTRARS
jgi:(R)-benzylsuccinyl-CoA dehydrogenase